MQLADHKAEELFYNAFSQYVEFKNPLSSAGLNVKCGSRLVTCRLWPQEHDTTEIQCFRSNSLGWDLFLLRPNIWTRCPVVKQIRNGTCDL